MRAKGLLRIQPSESLLKGLCSGTGGEQKDGTMEINRFCSPPSPLFVLFPLQQIKQREKTTLGDDLCCLGQLPQSFNRFAKQSVEPT